MMLKIMMRSVGLVSAFATIFNLKAAHAEGFWIFYLATKFDSHKAYFTSLLQSDDEKIAGLEDLVDRSLSRAGIAFDVVQCPLGHNLGQATNNLRQAKAFNLKIGNQIFDVLAGSNIKR